MASKLTQRFLEVVPGLLGKIKKLQAKLLGMTSKSRL